MMNLLFFSELILSSIDIDATGEWECLVKTSYGNITKKVEIVVLETAAPYCPAERVINNKGDFRYDFLALECFSYIDVGTHCIHAYMVLQCHLQITYFTCHFLCNMIGRRSTVWVWWEMGPSASREAVVCGSQKIFLIPQYALWKIFKNWDTWKKVQNFSWSL